MYEQVNRAGRAARVVRGQPAWLVKLVMLSLLIALAAVGLLVVVPAVLLALVIFVMGAGVVLLRLAARSLVTWLSSPFRAADTTGRRNVRVVTPR